MTTTGQSNSARPVLTFIVIAFTLSVALSLLIGLTGGHHSRWIGLGYLSMLIPSISVVVVNTMIPSAHSAILWSRFPSRYLPPALLLMPCLLHASMLPLAAAMGRLHWQNWLTPAANGLYHAPATLGWGQLTETELAARILLNAIFGFIIVSILAVFEEIGWRGWLLPHLIERIHPRRAVVISSLVWALWHVPYALSGIQHLDGVSPIWTAVVAPIGIFGSGLIIGWLWLRTQSIWIAAIAHGALNNWGQYAFKFVSGEGRPADAVLLLSGGVALLLMGLLLLYGEQRRPDRAISSVAWTRPAFRR